MGSAVCQAEKVEHRQHFIKVQPKQTSRRITSLTNMGNNGGERGGVLCPPCIQQGLTMDKNTHRNTLNNPKLSFTLQEVVKTQLIKHREKNGFSHPEKHPPGTSTKRAEGYLLLTINVSFCVSPIANPHKESFGIG